MVRKKLHELNTDKCHLTVSGKSYENVWVKLGKGRIWKSNNVELLGVKIDNEFKFDKHISNACLKANNKLSAVTRLSSSFSFEKRRTLFKAFIESQFKDCPLVWMFHGERQTIKLTGFMNISLE